MNLQEGQIYEGHISLMGEEGPKHRWLVVAPFGKTHIHSIDDPLDLHCWPAMAIQRGLEADRVQLVGHNPNHPVIQLQKCKEAMDIRDTDLGLSNENLHKMLSLLQELIAQDSEMATFAAGEVFALLRRTPIPAAHAKSIERHIAHQLKSAGNGARGAIDPS